MSNVVLPASDNIKRVTHLAIVLILLAGCGGDKAIMNGHAGAGVRAGDLRARSAFDAKANELVLKGDFDSLLAACDDFIRNDPSYARAYTARSLAWKAKNDIDKVIADRTTALSLLPPDERDYRCELHKSLGAIFLESGQYKDAIPHFNVLVALTPNEASSYLCLAVSQCEIGEHDAALASANQSIKIDPNNAASYVVRAKVWSALGDEAKAQADRKLGAERGQSQRRD